jgi:hypothetical protein
LAEGTDISPFACLSPVVDSQYIYTIVTKEKRRTKQRKMKNRDKEGERNEDRQRNT